MDESHEAQLLRLLIGYFHVSLLQQLSVIRHSKSFELLDQPDKDALSNDMVAAVASVSKSVTPETVQALLSSVPGPPPIIQ